jgi:hypothetical protein
MGGGGGAGPGAYGGGPGAFNAGMQGGGGRQLYVSNVGGESSPQPLFSLRGSHAYLPSSVSPQLPYTVGWQDLKDLFRQAGKSSSKGWDPASKCSVRVFGAD